MTSTANSVAANHLAAPASAARRSVWNTAAARTMLCVAVFAVVAFALGWHVRHILAVPGVADDSHAGLIDFRDQAYYPVRALLDGNNPYDAARFMSEYPAVKVFAPYSPVLLVLFLPFGLLPLGAAQAAYYAVTVVLVLVLARMALRLGGWRATTAQVFGLATLILCSRPGEWNAVLGQFAVLGALAICAALAYGAERPVLAGVALAVSLFKPTYGVPVALLMLARGDRRAAYIGLAIAALLSLAVAAVLAHSAGGVGPFVGAFANGIAAWRAESGDPLHTVYRVDAAALVARVLGHSPGIAVELAVTALVLGLSALLMRRSQGTSPGGTAGAVAGLGALVTLTAVYHLLYDLLLLVVPVAWMLRQATQRAGLAGRAVCAIIGVLLALPLANYAASERAAALLGPTSMWWNAATGLNAAAPVIGLVLWASAVLLGSRRPAQ